MTDRSLERDPADALNDALGLGGHLAHLARERSQRKYAGIPPTSWRCHASRIPSRAEWQAFEEICGVRAARAAGVLTREEYRSLGVRQSIFPEGERDRLYDLFDRYRTWLTEAKLYDLNLIAHD